MRLECPDTRAKGASPAGVEDNTCLRKDELLPMTPHIQLLLVP